MVISFSTLQFKTVKISNPLIPSYQKRSRKCRQNSLSLIQIELMTKVTRPNTRIALLHKSIHLNQDRLSSRLTLQPPKLQPLKLQPQRVRNRRHYHRKTCRCPQKFRPHTSLPTQSFCDTLRHRTIRMKLVKDLCCQLISRICV